MKSKNATRGLAVRLVMVLLACSFLVGIAINVFWKGNNQVSNPVENESTEQGTTEPAEELSKQIAEKFIIPASARSTEFMMSSSAEEFVEDFPVEEEAIDGIVEEVADGVAEDALDGIAEEVTAPDKMEEMIVPMLDPIPTTVQSGENLIDEETRLYDAITTVKVYPYETTICYDTEKIAEYKNFLSSCYSGEYDVEDLPILDYYTNDDMLLARIIQAEAGGTEQYYEDPYQRLNELIAVGSVVLSRVRSEGYDFKCVHTISEVLYQKNQYARATISKVEGAIQPCDEAILAAKILLRVADIMVYDSDGYWHQVGTNMVGQTGLSLYPSWGNVMFQTRWHYYANFD